MLYLDSSAIVKLVSPEPETAALVQALRSDPEAVSSELARVEVLRAVRRTTGARGLAGRAEEVLDRIAMIPIEAGILARAAELPPLTLRTLDAIHLATAMFLGSDASAIVTYDDRLEDAALAAGLSVLRPN
jgi:predicted nucleic acid-binding protein